MSALAEELIVDVDVWDDEPTHLAARWYAPDTDGGPPPALLVCVPGGTYNGRYWDLDVDDGAYDFARWMADRAYAVPVVDVLGTGASSRPWHEVGIAEQARATAALVDHIRGRLAAGTPVIGFGHSMGGYHVVVQQATARSYDGIAVLGTTMGAVRILSLPDDMIAAALAGPEARTEMVAGMLSGFAEQYFDGDHVGFGADFHLPDVPAHVLAADAAQASTCVPRRCAVESMVPYYFSAEAATVDVPVLLAYGEVDVSLAPDDEPTYYASSPDVTRYHLAGSSHCHNMAATRVTLWEQLHRWLEGLPGASAA